MIDTTVDVVVIVEAPAIGFEIRQSFHAGIAEAEDAGTRGRDRIQRGIFGSIVVVAECRRQAR